MSAEFSFLCGNSYAWQAGYKPKAFEKLEKVLISEELDPESDFAKRLIIKDRKLVEQIWDSYCKLGFLLLARDYIRKVNGKYPLAHIYVSYHLHNFIYDCKAFLDAVAVMLNDFYSIGKTNRHIDFKESSFRDAVAGKEPNLQMIIKKYESWFVTVASWRDTLIHKLSTTIAPYSSSTSFPSSKEELDQSSLRPCMMLVEPRHILQGELKELERKYGKGNLFREIDPFCEEWIEKVCKLYDEVCNVILENLR